MNSWAIAVVLGIVEQRRARSAQRLSAALHTFVERESTRARAA